MIKRKIFIFVFSLLLLFSLFGQVFAYFPSLNIINEFTNGAVDIAIGDKSIIDNSNGYNTVLPFDKIDRNPYIVNNGADCYVRIKFVFSNSEIVNEDNLIWLNPDLLQKNDGYYYYNKILKSNDFLDIFDGIQLGDIDEQHQLTDFGVDIQVDAVQSKNFSIDFNAENPWGVVEVLHIDENYPQIKEYKQLANKTINIECQGDMGSFVKNFDNFFCDLSILMPGDIYSDVLEIKNSGEQVQKIYFSTHCIENKEFLNKVKMTVVDECGNTVFDGVLGEDESFVLCDVNAKSNSKLTFTINVSAEIGNEHASETSVLQWIFSTEQIITPSNPKTGDNTNIQLYFVLMIISAAGLILSIGAMKYDKKNC